MTVSSFRSRLFVILVFITLCVLLLGGTASFLLDGLNKRLDGLANGVYARLEIAGHLREAADARAIAVRNLALLTDPAGRAAQVREFNRRQAETSRTLDALVSAIAAADVPDEVRRQIARVAEVEARYSPVAASIVARLDAGERESAIADIERVCTPALAELSDAIHDYTVSTETRTRARVLDIEATTDRQRGLLLGAAVIAAAVAAGLGLLLRRHVRRTLGAEPEALRADLARLAEGDLSDAGDSGAAAPHDHSLAAELTRVRRKIGGIVGQVRASSESIAAGAARIADGNGHLSERTEAQTGSIQRTASAMEQFGGTVSSTADNARQASQLAESAAGVASQGGEVVSRVVATMHGISESSRRVGAIVEVIDGIAFQTNILALNAAVEAARAGEQGRGFAVVAGEVRALAQRSAEAAREIKGLIGSNVEQVGQGTALVDQAGRTMDEIVTSIRRVNDIVSDIASATVEQSGGLRQVSDDVVEMDRATQQNTSLVSESAAAAEQLRGEAQQLVAAVSVFRLARG
ncbi:methyl-accepting chemotaxis protein [Derxia gummosa]|uniref:Methyl-accepting chemotaxis protein n=1 Tax=Derxia gummosa DSM 723 TaxID=1121388 RepID=A0A8B6X814_9BURK|nr:methyl-accepting chemotaxis protein [Derxia gummosa]